MAVMEAIGEVPGVVAWQRAEAHYIKGLKRVGAVRWIYGE